jgi:hypothetical protein
MREGQVAEACREFGESQRLDPGGGTLLNLAICHEREGRTASAWGELTLALSQARAGGREDRARLAAEHLATLEPRLTRLVVDVPPATDLPDLELLRDGSPLDRAEWGSALLVDPGEHVLLARAAGRTPRTLSVVVLADAKVTRLTVPPLDAVGGPADAAPPAPQAAVPVLTPAPPAPPRGQRIAGAATAAAGAAGVLVGAVFGTIALSERTRAGGECDSTSRTCTGGGYGLMDDSARHGTIATIALAAGAAGLVTGGVLWLTAPREPRQGEAAVRVAPRVDRNLATLSIEGRW